MTNCSGCAAYSRALENRRFDHGDRRLLFRYPKVSHEVLWECGAFSHRFSNALASIQSDTKTCRTPKASQNRVEGLAFLYAFTGVFREFDIDGDKAARANFAPQIS